MATNSQNLPKRYGWNTPVTAPGPDGGLMLRSIKTIIKDPLTYLTQSHADHGPVIQFPVPKPATYSISSAIGAREVLVTQQQGTTKETLQYRNLALVTGEGLLTAESQAWRPRRRMLQPAFHREMVALTQGHVIAGLAKLDQQWQLATQAGPAIIDIDDAMMTLALEITCNALFGLDVSGEATELTSATLTALHGVVSRAQNPLALPLAIPTPNNWRMSRAIHRLDEAVSEIIHARAEDRLPSEAPIRDMLDVLLDPDLETPLTAKQIRDEIATFIVAGHETVASALTWAWDLLVHNPDELESLAITPDRAELVFDESLRLYPPAWVITRRTSTDIEVEGFEIPAKSLVIVSPWVIHRNPQVWEEPLAFRPDRFSGGVPQLGYLPFGVGPRLCIGREMARLEGAMILRHIASNWKLSAIHTGPTPIDASVTLRPVGSLPLRLSRRDA
jgi:cytochrome P450